jgi:hypothetical protein
MVRRARRETTISAAAAAAAAVAAAAAATAVPSPAPWRDDFPVCAKFAREGQCLPHTASCAWMRLHCPVACRVPPPTPPPATYAPTPPDTYAPTLLPSTAALPVPALPTPAAPRPAVLLPPPTPRPTLPTRLQLSLLPPPAPRPTLADTRWPTHVRTPTPRTPAPAPTKAPLPTPHLLGPPPDEFAFCPGLAVLGRCRFGGSGGAKRGGAAWMLAHCARSCAGARAMWAGGASLPTPTGWRAPSALGVAAALAEAHFDLLSPADRGGARQAGAPGT